MLFMIFNDLKKLYLFIENNALKSNTMKRIFLCFFVVVLSLSINAKVVLPQIIGDNMMLQQNTRANIWGWDKADRMITVATTWSNETYTVKTGKDGRWLVKIKTPAASYKVYEITISDGDKTTIRNVLVGEVWFASGQSNMEMPLNGFWNCPIAKSNEVIALSGENEKRIRFVKIPKTPATTPQDSVPGKWVECTPENAPDFSATAYFYADFLTHALNVPVGIIDCNWGGSRVESWSNRELCEEYGEDLSNSIVMASFDAPNNWTRPLAMFNGMLHPLVNYTIKGFIWYQGESNVGHADQYVQRFSNMIQLWRSLWEEGDIPFYYCQIAPWLYGDGADGISSALLREAQYNAQKVIPNSGMICTNDLVQPYELSNIHPSDKQDVGMRLAFMAMNRTYGVTSISCYGPEYKSMEVKGNSVALTFDYVNNGYNRTEGIVGFEVAGADQKFYPATQVAVDPNSHIITVKCNDVVQPVAVRYCFTNTAIGNLKNTRGLPVVPFRTDRW